MRSIEELFSLILLDQSTRLRYIPPNRRSLLIITNEKIIGLSGSNLLRFEKEKGCIKFKSDKKKSKPSRHPGKQLEKKVWADFMGNMVSEVDTRSLREICEIVIYRKKTIQFSNILGIKQSRLGISRKVMDSHRGDDEEMVSKLVMLEEREKGEVNAVRENKKVSFP